MEAANDYSENIYSPHCDFYIDKCRRPDGFEMQYFHFHRKFEIYYAVEGSLKFFIDNSIYLVNAGNLVLLGADSVLKTTCAENKPFTRYVVNFSPDYLLELSKAFPDAELMKCFDHGLNLIQLSLKRQQTVESLLSLMWESQPDSSEGEVSRKLVLGQLLLYLDSCAIEAKSKEAGKTSNSIVEGAQKYISANFSSKLTLTDIAKHVFVNEHYLSRLFKKSTGVGIIEYINNIRLAEARRLLEKTTLNVSSVGEMVGFGTTTHFSRLFKDSMGMSPQGFRKLFHSRE
ncbi:MAG: AraC family transcriptional regulator [Clostridiales bacterium]|jgi:AraC-like DNA-binding protein|nr:AraC family transcriptional regulator [Clostridiales bacterium]